jgi:hypothetical protein
MVARSGARCQLGWVERRRASDRWTGSSSDFWVARGPYFFPDLAGTSEADERAAIDAGLIRDTRADYVGRRPSPAT